MYSKTDFSRLLAVILDSFFVCFISSLFVSLIDNNPDAAMFYRFEVLCFLAYFMLFDLRNNGQTLGKILVKIRPSEKHLKQRISHSFLKTVSIIVFPITILIYLVKGKIIHDLLENKQESIHT